MVRLKDAVGFDASRRRAPGVTVCHAEVAVQVWPIQLPPMPSALARNVLRSWWTRPSLPVITSSTRKINSLLSHLLLL